MTTTQYNSELDKLDAKQAECEAMLQTLKAIISNIEKINS